MELKSTISIIITVFVFISITTLIFTGIAYIEKGNKENKLFEKTSNLVSTAIGLFITITILLLILEYSFSIRMGSSLMFIIIGVIKILVGSYVSSKAKKQNRNSTLWFVLGFIEYHSALLALAFGKSIYKVPTNNKALFKELKEKTKEKISSLKELSADVRKGNNSVAIQREYTIPLGKIQREYFEKFDSLLNKVQQDISLQKIERAYKSGVINKEEYDSKVSAINKP